MIRKLLLLMCLLSCCCVYASNDNDYNKVEYGVLPALSVGCDQGVSAAFAGVSGDVILVAGGCNFPDKPASEGGAKRYYSDVYILKDPLSSNPSWQKIGSLPNPVAYGVSVSVPEGVICIGGTDGEHSFSDVFLLSIVDGRLQQKALPSLLVGLDNMAGAYGNGYVYVAAGMSNGVTSMSLYRLKYPGGTSWERIADVPGLPRVQPTAVIQNGSTTPQLYLMGGYVPATDERGVVHDDIAIYNIQMGTWSKSSPMAVDGKMRALVGANAVASGCAHIVCIGGVNRDIFDSAINRKFDIEKARASKDEVLAKTLEKQNEEYMSHDASWYKFQDELLIYHTITDTWVTESRSPLMARAGASVVPYNGKWIVINGETMPGVRSADVSVVTMSVRTHFGWLNRDVLVV